MDEQSIQDFERKLKDNLYKLWNRLSSGSYFPPPVRRVEIPKSDGGKRPLGIPTVSDRIAQMVVKLMFEPDVEPYFHDNSYGYRPGRSAAQAVGVARRRCWRYDFVVDLDIRAFFDSMDHTLLMRAVRKHTTCPWVRLYIERWLKAPVQYEDGTVEARDRGTPQGGVISPLLANLFLHYAFDKWMQRIHPDNPFERYADDAIVHCRSEAEAHRMKEEIEQRLAECGLTMHPDKTKIVYCRDQQRQGSYPQVQFDFLGYSFQPRQAKAKRGNLFVGASFLRLAPKLPRRSAAPSGVGGHTDGRSSRSRNLPERSANPVLRGWIGYYGQFYKSKLASVLGQFDYALRRWARRKFKRLKAGPTRAGAWLRRVAQQKPDLFAHWAITFAGMAER